MANSLIRAQTWAVARFPTCEGALDDRRRPGRLKEVSAELLPLLRAVPDADTLGGADQGTDPLRVFRGLLFGTAIGLMIWAGAFCIVRTALLS